MTLGKPASFIEDLKKKEKLENLMYIMLLKTYCSSFSAVAP